MADTVPEKKLVLNDAELVDTVFERGPEEEALVELWTDEVVGIDVTETPDEIVRLDCCCLSAV